MVEPGTPEREFGGSKPTSAVLCLLLLEIPRERWLCPDMNEKLFTGTLSLNKTKLIGGVLQIPK